MCLLCSIGGKQWLASSANARSTAAQSVGLAVAVLRLITREEERQAGLALASTIRKRLLNLPGGLASDEAWRVRSTKVFTQAARRRLLLWCLCQLTLKPSAASCACCS